MFVGFVFGFITAFIGSAIFSTVLMMVVRSKWSELS